jgi:PTH1 family peptidyl-tRNA hydrolase
MKLIVGLGNPGPRFRETRHNVGFEVVERLGRRWQIETKREKFHAWFGEGQVAGQPAVLLMPTTYMNLSGQAVLAAGRFYKLEAPDLLVVVDDMDLPVGRLRLRAGGSSGGQKGLLDIEQRLGMQEFARLRLGIGRPAFGAVDHVLTRFDEPEREIMEKVIERSADAVENWVREGCERTMTLFNGWSAVAAQDDERDDAGA